MKENETKEKILITAFKYINNVGWNNFNFDDLSSKEKISSKRLNELFKNKQSLLSYFSSFIDEQVIKELGNEELGKNEVKDNIFEVVMIRFEKLQPYKKGLRSIFELLKVRPKMLNSVAKQLFLSLDLVLELSMAKKNFLLLVVVLLK